MTTLKHRYYLPNYNLATILILENKNFKKAITKTESPGNAMLRDTQYLGGEI